MWLTPSNPSSSYDWKNSKSMLGINKIFKVEGEGITEIIIPKNIFDEEDSSTKSLLNLSKLTPMDVRRLRIRFAGDKEDVEKPDSYARSGETEEYKVNMKNITGTKTSITQDGDHVAEPGERITYTFNFKNNSSKDTNVVLNDDFINVLNVNGYRIGDIDENSLKIIKGKSYISSRIESDKLILTANKLPSNETIQAKIDVVIKNPLPLFVKNGSVLENSMELIENGVSIKISDEDPPTLKKGKSELTSIKEFLAYRNEEKVLPKEERVFVLPNDIVEYTIKINNEVTSKFIKK